MKLREAVDFLNEIIEEDKNASSELAIIYIQPPDPAYDSAEDDADDEEGGTLMDLHHNQINQMVEIEFIGRDGDDTLYEVDDDEQQPPDEEPAECRPR